MLLGEPLDGAGKRLSGNVGQGVFPTVARVATLARFAEQHVFGPCTRTESDKVVLGTLLTLRGWAEASATGPMGCGDA